MIADDLTGGGDIGIQFADKGLQVTLSIDVDEIKDIPMETEVWVINTNSRSESPKSAVKKVTKAVAYLKEWNAQFHYKKIDSTLRGNLGVELEAYIDALGIEKLPFCAAFPDMGRITKDTVHFVNGQKISESPYSRDIKSPVTESNIRKLLAAQTEKSEKIEVEDAVTNEDLEILSRDISGNVFAGAAAWAGWLADRWLSAPRKVKTVVVSPGPVLVVSGSLNPVSLGQIEYWEKKGLNSIRFTDTKDTGDLEEEDLLIKTVEEEAAGSLKKLNKAATNLFDSKKWSHLILNGGDTAHEFMMSCGIKQVNVIKSIIPGIALTEYDGKYIILKPGGYGMADHLVKLARLLDGR